jgi:hypothetical protein
MLVPGVLQGSKGPLLYPPDEVRKSPDDWNHIPIVVYHPMKDGKPVSARSPSILSKYGVGFVFHSRTDSKGVLKGEGWLDVEATRRVDKSVLDSVQLGKPIELSTGLFVDDEPAPEGAIFNDHRGTRKYVGIARNYKPDHLAILPSGKGACSLADGCGVLINEAAMEAYQVIINELETEAISLYFPDLEFDLLTANKFNPNQPRDKAGRFATVAEGTAAVSKAQERVAKAQAALKEAKATLKVEKDGLLVARKGLAEVKGIEKARSPAGQRAIEKAKASTTEAHATGKRLKELSDRLTGGVGRQGKGTADLQAEGRSEASKALAGIRTKAHAAAVAEGFGILPGKTVAETKATISRHIETRIGSVARSRLTERPEHTGDSKTSSSAASKASTETAPRTGGTRSSPVESKKAGTKGLRLAEQFSTDLKAVSDSNGHHHDRELAKRTADELNKTATRMGKPELLDVLDTFTQGISRKVYEKRSATALRSELGRILSSTYGATLRSTAASESGIASKPSNPRAHVMGKATGGSRPATDTPAPSRPATSPRAGARSKSTVVSPSTGKPPKSVDHHIEKTKNLLAQSLSVDKATVKAHVDQMGKDLNKSQVLEVAKSIGLGGKQKTKKDALKIIHDTITRQKGVYTRGLE